MLIKRVVRIIKYFIISILLLFLLLFAGINLPFVQRIITAKANSIFIQKEIPVHVEKITLLIDGRIGLTRPAIILNPSDTIVYAGKIKISVKIVPLVFKKVRVESISIQDGVINLSIDSATGELNLISIFSKGNKATETSEKPEEKWQISVDAINLGNIRFTFNDAKNGTRVCQNVGKLNVGIDRFSLADKEIFTGSIDLTDANGGIVLQSTAHEKDTVEKSTPDWKFKISRADFKNISFTFKQPEQKQRMEFTLGNGDISEVGFNPAGKKLTVDRLSLNEPGILIFSSEDNTGDITITKVSSDSDFPRLWNIACENAKISNGFFHTRSYSDSTSSESEKSLLQIAAITTAIKDIKLSSRESGFTINQLSVALDNGFRLDKGEIIFSSDSTRNTRLQSNLRTESSRINLKIDAANDLQALIASWKTVPFSLTIDDTEVSSADILALLPVLNDKSLLDVQKKLNFGLNCSITGTAGSLDIKSFKIKTPAGNNLSLSGQLINILNPKSAQVNIDFLAGPVTVSPLKEILKITGSTLNLPDFEPTSVQGSLTGSITSQKFLLNIEGLSGNIEAGGSLDLQDKSYTLKTIFRDVELGKLAGIKDMDRLSGNLDITGKEFSPEKMEIKATITIDSAGYRGYNYHDIKAELSGKHGIFNYAVNSADPSFEVNLTGTAELNKTLTGATISGNFNIDAGDLNIYNGMTARGILEAELNRDGNDLETSVSLKDVLVSNGNKTEDLANLALSFQSTDSLVSGIINADFAQADFRFESSLDDLGKVFKKNRSRGLYLVDSTVSNKIPFVSLLPVMNLSVESTYDPFIGLVLSDSIFSYKRISINMAKDSAGITMADMSVDKFNIGTSNGYGASLHFLNKPDSSIFLVKADSIKYDKISLTRLKADLSAENDTLLYRLKASNRKDSLLYDIEGAAYKSGRDIKMIATQQEWILNGFHWSVTPGVFLVLEPWRKDLVADLHWKNGEHTIDIYGRKSEKLGLELSKIWINMLTIPGMNTFGYDGELTGKISYKGNTGNELGIQMDIRQMKISEKLLGYMKIEGSYISDTLGNIESDIRSTMNDTSSLNASISIGRNSELKSIRSEFSYIPLNMFESLASKYVKGLEGEISGDFELKSTVNKPRLDGTVKFYKAGLTVVPLNARFYLDNDVVKLENNQLLFKNFTVQDSLKKQLTVNGGINLIDPGNITADLQITSDHLQVMNTTAKENPGFNGSVFVDSKLSISGPVQKPLISGSIVLAEGTVVNYKLTENLNVSETEKTITFASLNEEGAVKKKSKVNHLSRTPNIEASIEINPNSLFSFEISRGYDIGITISGGGFLNYAVLPNGTISLSGTYNINQGKSELKIPGWPRKDFVITPGSFVKWNGPVDDPELNIETTSKVRGSYYNPVDNKNREVNFIVNMKIYNRLSQLEILFDVSSNDQYITSVFSTLSKDERMKQAINLLIFERIELPNMASSSDYVSQQINQFWESQINQLTKSAIKGVDLSFGIDTYTGAKEGGGEQTYTSFTYEVKKEMFNERGTVLVSGRMNDNSQAGAPTNNMLENFIFEYALDTNRTKYLKVYRQQNYEDLLQGEVIKSGVGFIYRKSYNRLGDIWKRKSKKDSKRENTGNAQ